MNSSELGAGEPWCETFPVGEDPLTQLALALKELYLAQKMK